MRFSLWTDTGRHISAARVFQRVAFLSIVCCEPEGTCLFSTL